MTGKIRDRLLSGDRRIGIWGTGFIGFTTMAHYAARGIRSLGYDIDPKMVERINAGEIPQANLGFWLGFEIRPFVQVGTLKATGDAADMLERDVAVHFICVPTEREGQPWDGALLDVLKRLASLKPAAAEPPLIIIESTLTPNRTDELVIPTLESKGLKVGKDVLLAVAPRRDWFISPDMNLRTLPRVVGSQNAHGLEETLGVLSIVCEKLLPAPDHRHSEIVKSVENAYRHMDITLANQLALAYPSIDIREVLQLVGTKWNQETFQPSFGTGGYCIPLASQYVLLGAEHPEALTLLRETIATDQGQPSRIADSLAARKVKSVGILGLAYKGDIRVHILSPTLRLAQRLRERGIQVKANDPYYTDEEVRRLSGAEAFKFPEGLRAFDCVLLVADHRAYKSLPHGVLAKHLANCRMILDNTGLWSDIPFPAKVEYLRPGAAGWLGDAPAPDAKNGRKEVRSAVARAKAPA